MRLLPAAVVFFAVSGLPAFLAGEGAAMADTSHETIPEERSAEYWYWRGMFHLQLGAEYRESALYSIEKASGKGFAQAWNFLGSAYLNGFYGFAQDPVRARELFEKAAAANNGYAMVSLAEALHNAWGGAQDTARAKKLAERALDPATRFFPQFPDEQFYNMLTPEELERMEAMSLSVTTRLADPVLHAKNGARTILGLIARDGGDEDAAAAYFIGASELEKNGEAGIPQSAIEAGHSFALGLGVERDFQTAMEYLELAVDLEKSAAADMAGMLLQQEILGQMDMADFVSDADGLAREAHLERLQKYGNMFSNADHPRFDPTEALAWYGAAAGLGEWNVIDELVELYLNAEYKTSNPKEARRWLRTGWTKGKHAVSGLNYAICLREGIGGNRDPEAADLILRDLKERLFTAHLVYAGEGPKAPLSPEAVLENDLVWAKEGDPHAQFCYGLRLETGDGVVENQVRAENWYEKAIEQGHNGARVALARILMNRHSRLSDGMQTRIAELLRPAMDAGFPGSLFQMANLLFRSDPHGSIFDAISLYEAHLEHKPGDPEALNNYAEVLIELLDTRYFKGDPKGESARLARAIRMFEEAASGGSAKAHANLGKVYYQGKLVEKDYQKALLYFGKASDLGDVASTYDLGFMYLEGMGTQADTEIAAYHFRRVIETGDSFSDIYKQSLDNLIQFYLDGRLTRRNPDLFLYWVSLKSKSDVPSAYRSLGRFHMQEGRYAEALDLFNELKLIEIKKTETIFIDGQNLQFTYADPQEGILRGFAYANLGRIYRDGLGVEENPAQSEACFTRAVEYGNADGYYWAATKFLEKGDEAQGMDCLLLAADSGSPTACLEIARDFMEGSGMQIPMEERIYYLQQAAEMGSPEAMLLLAESHLLQFPHAPSFSQAFQLALQARNLGSSEALEIIRKFEAIKADNESKGSGSSLDQRLG